MAIKRQYEQDGMQITEYTNGTIIRVAISDPEPEPQPGTPPAPAPTQLDRIEQAVAQSKQQIIDDYTLSLIQAGALK